MPDPSLDREFLLLALHRTASATAIGEDDGRIQRELDGKRFQLRLRFGCPGEVASARSTRNWKLDRDGQSVALEIGTEIDRNTPLVEEIAGPDVEDVDGFWIRRPWLLKAACPARPVVQASLEDATPKSAGNARLPSQSEIVSINESAPWFGIAQFFTATDARTHRRNSRAYQASESLSEGEAPSSSGYDLTVTGRLQGLSDGRVIACRYHGVQPSCIVSARFEEVSIKRVDNGKILASWPRG